MVQHTPSFEAREYHRLPYLHVPRLEEQACLTILLVLGSRGERQIRLPVQVRARFELDIDLECVCGVCGVCACLWVCECVGVGVDLVGMVMSSICG